MNNNGIGLKFHLLDEETSDRINRLIIKLKENKVIRSQFRKDDLVWLTQYLEQVIE